MRSRRCRFPVTVWDSRETGRSSKPDWWRVTISSLLADKKTGSSFLPLRFRMPPFASSRRAFLASSVVLAATSPLAASPQTPSPQRKPVADDPANPSGPLLAYVGTFSAPLRDVLPTQVDLPPGNGRGIHIFSVNRETGDLTPAGLLESGTSPSSLVINSAGTHMYSADETARVGTGNIGTVSAYSIDRQDGQLKLLNSVPSGGA